jgi:3-hydroxyisobutyrate dehydrogenase-like beta-hydroxyacid dehydrogenase
MGASIAASMMDSGCEVWWVAEGRRAQSIARAESIGLRDAGSLAELCASCDGIVSVCPPEFALGVAESVAACGFHGVFADVNALAPAHKVAMGQILAEQGIAFADGGVIGLPSRVQGETTVFLSGPAASTVAAWFAHGRIGAEVIAGEVGKASALKILFAAHNKGTIALRTALYAAAEEYGILAELQGQFAHRGLSLEKIEVEIRRAAAKAWRWVAEMQEIGESLESVGMPGDFHAGAAKVYERLRSLKDQDPTLAEVLRTVRATSSLS